MYIISSSVGTAMRQVLESHLLEYRVLEYRVLENKTFT